MLAELEPKQINIGSEDKNGPRSRKVEDETPLSKAELEAELAKILAEDSSDDSRQGRLPTIGED